MNKPFLYCIRTFNNKGVNPLRGHQYVNRALIVSWVCLELKFA